MLTVRAMTPRPIHLKTKHLPPSKTPDLQFFQLLKDFMIIRKINIFTNIKHLGNIRVSFGRNSTGALKITDANDYYPFGMNHLKTGNAIFWRENIRTMARGFIWQTSDVGEL